MENEQVLTVVVVIAVVAVIGRIIINRQQQGKINWPKIGWIAAIALVFVGVLLSVDSYRLATWSDGAVESSEDFGTGHVVGRTAGKCVPAALRVSEGLPMYFVLDVDSLAPTGYWMIKEGSADEATTREVLVSRTDSTKTAIKHTTSTFSIMRHPSDESDYNQIYRICLSSGEKVLAVMADYDAHTGRTPVMTSRPLPGKMADIASHSEEVSQMVYVSSFDSAYYAASTARRFLYAALVALAAAAIVGSASYGIFHAIKK